MIKEAYCAVYYLQILQFSPYPYFKPLWMMLCYTQYEFGRNISHKVMQESMQTINIPRPHPGQPWGI
jgi:hypothetical protein